MRRHRNVLNLLTGLGSRLSVNISTIVALYAPSVIALDNPTSVPSEISLAVTTTRLLFKARKKRCGFLFLSPAISKSLFNSSTSKSSKEEDIIALWEANLAKTTGGAGSSLLESAQQRHVFFLQTATLLYSTCYVQKLISGRGAYL